MSNTLNFPSAQRGFSLIVTLLMLAVIIILGVGAANMALNEERGSRADRDRQIALQAAEAALVDAEQELSGASGVACSGDVNKTAAADQIYRGRTLDICFDGKSAQGFASGCSTATGEEGLCLPTDGSVPPLWSTVDFSTRGIAYGTKTGNTFPVGGPGQSAQLPRYIIELVPRNNVVGEGYKDNPMDQPHMYRITGVGYGPSPTLNTQVMLQSVVNTRTED